MATGTIAKLAIILGVESAGVTAGMLAAKKQVTTGLASMQAEADAAGRHGSGTLLNVAKGAAAVVGTVALVVGGLADLAIHFESDAGRIAASAGITVESARSIAKGFVDMSKSGQTIFTAKEITEAYASVAGQLGSTEGHALKVAEAEMFMHQANLLAGASGESLANASSALSEIMQAYQIKVKDAGSATDILFNVSKNLHEPLDTVTTTLARLHSQLGVVTPSLSDTATMMEVAANAGLDMTRSQRNLNYFTGAIQALTNTSPSVKALATAQAELAKAEERLALAHQKAGSSSFNLALAQRTAYLDHEKYLIAVAKDGPASMQAATAQVTWQRAVDALTASHSKGSATIIADEAAVAAAQAKVNGLLGGTPKLWKDLGLTVFNAQGGFIGMRSIIQQLNPIFAEHTKQWQLATATQLFGSAKMADIMIPLINAGTGAWDKHAAAANKAGSAAKGYASATDNIGAKWHILISELSGYLTTAALQLEPYLKGAIDWAISALPGAVKVVGQVWNVGAGAAKDFWSVAGPIVGVLEHFWPLAVGLLALMIARWAALKAINAGKEVLGWASATLNWVANTRLMVADNGPLDTLLKKMGLKTGGLAGALNDTKTAWSNMTDVIKNDQTLKNVFGGIGQAAEAAAKDPLTNIANGMAGVVEAAAKDEQAFQKMQNTADLAFTAMARKAGVSANQMQSALNELGLPDLASKVGGWGKSATAQVLKDLETPLDTAAADFGSKLEQNVADNSSKISRDLSNVMKGAATDLTTAITDEAPKVTNVLGKATGLAGKFFSVVGTLTAQNVFIVGASAAYLAEMKLAGSGPGGGGGLTSVVEKVAGGALTGTATLAGLTTAGLVTIVGSVIVGLGLGALMVWANRNAKVVPGGAFGGGKEGPGSTGTNIFADLQAAAAYGKSGNPRMQLLISDQYQGIIDQLKKRGLTEAQAESDASKIEAAYSKGAITTPAALDVMLNTILNGAAGVKAAISYYSGKIYQLAANITVTRTTSGYIPGLAGGGNVLADHLYMVGEYGPELFASEDAGQIIPLNQLTKVQPKGAAGASYNVPAFSQTGADIATRTTVNIGNIIVNNPTPEPASQSVERNLRQISYLGQQ